MSDNRALWLLIALVAVNLIAVAGQLVLGWRNLARGQPAPRRGAPLQLTHAGQRPKPQPVIERGPGGRFRRVK